MEAGKGHPTSSRNEPFAMPIDDRKVSLWANRDILHCGKMLCHSIAFSARAAE
jgi:hypothetical protein